MTSSRPSAGSAAAPRRRAPSPPNASPRTSAERLRARQALAYRGPDDPRHIGRVAQQRVERVAREDDGLDTGRRHHDREPRVPEPGPPLERRELAEEVAGAEVAEVLAVAPDRRRPVEQDVEVARRLPPADDLLARRGGHGPRGPRDTLELRVVQGGEEPRRREPLGPDPAALEPGVGGDGMAVTRRRDDRRLRRGRDDVGGLEPRDHALDVGRTRRVVQDAQPQRVAAAQARRGDQAEAGPGQAGDELRVPEGELLFVVDALEAAPEAGHAERRGKHELERLALLDAPL